LVVFLLLLHCPHLHRYLRPRHRYHLENSMKILFIYLKLYSFHDLGGLVAGISTETELLLEVSSAMRVEERQSSTCLSISRSSIVNILLQTGHCIGVFDGGADSGRNDLSFFVVELPLISQIMQPCPWQEVQFSLWR
jgi:hypothetical protein